MVDKTINLSSGLLSIVDEDDYERLSQYKWYGYKCKSTFYARTNAVGHMHRFILKIEQGHIVDHINRNGLDNRKANLRICSIRQNNCNSEGHNKTKSSIYKGVTWRKDSSIWVAQIKSNGQKIYLGRYDKEIDAAIAYNEAVKLHHGEFGFLNEVGNV